jgi:hypothetical protein
VDAVFDPTFSRESPLGNPQAIHKPSHLRAAGFELRRHANVLVLITCLIAGAQSGQKRGTFADDSDVVPQEDERAVFGCENEPLVGAADPRRIQSAPGMARFRSILGPEIVASVTCQQRRSPRGFPVVGPHGPAIVSLYIISATRFMVSCP